MPNPNDIKHKETHTMKVLVTKEHLEKLLNYLYDDEKNHYEVSGKPKDHIYRSVRTLTLESTANRGEFPLTPKDALNILDVLKEWNDHPDLGPKELEESDVGLDYERYLELKARLNEHKPKGNDNE